MTTREEKNRRDRELLRRKRKDPEYLAQQRINRAAQMRATRAIRKRNGCCRECEKKAWAGHAYCRTHLLYERNRTNK